MHVPMAFGLAILGDIFLLHRLVITFDRQFTSVHGSRNYCLVLTENRRTTRLFLGLRIKARAR